MEGLHKFLDFAFANKCVEGKIICPCPKCKFNKWQTREVVLEHLIIKPFPKGYTFWLLHGETSCEQTTIETPLMSQQNEDKSPTNDPICDMVNDAFGNFVYNNDVEDYENLIPESSQIMPDDIVEYFELMKDGQQSLYDGCDKYSKLSFLIKLYHIKCLCKISDKAMSMILELLADVFVHAKIPHTFYEAKKIINKLGLNYSKIDVCPYDCMLYFGEDKDRETCKKCNTSRWKPKSKKKKTNDGMLRHPRDSEAWKNFDLKHPQFALDPRNVRLGLATDGFNPFAHMNVSHSIWKVVLINSNIHTWMCMKDKELKELWYNGLRTFDSYNNEVFNMHAALLWTISDFPGLGTLSGWNVHTGLACPRCNFDFTSNHLRNSKKFCFMGHRRFLNQRHKFRLVRSRFKGNVENRNPPLAITGMDVLQQVENLNVVFGKQPEEEVRGKRKQGERHTKVTTMQWRKKSIFFELPYWVNNLLHHNLDVMHIEKNVCDNVIFTLLNDSTKSKDNLSARKDLQEWGIRPDLWPEQNGKYLPAIYTLTKENKDIFLRTLKNITVPDGYSSNISRCIDLNQRKLGGLKSHDSHVLMEQLLPLAIRKALPKQVCSVLIDLCSFFRQLCNKVLQVDELDQLQSRVVITLCHMEMLFPPSFFTVMVHLIVHLVEDAKLGGLVQYRWMYPIVRYLGKLKSYVRNRAQPEGSIAEGYMAEEALTFCSRYLDGIETIFNRLGRVNDEPDIVSHSQSTLFPPIDDLKFLAMGPIDCAKRYSAYNVNGFKFRTLERDQGLKTQNSGIFGTFGTRSYASSSDNQMQFGGVPYYGKLLDIIEINYQGRFSVTLFKCMWANTTTSRGIVKDDLGFTLVSFAHLIHTGDDEDDEPYIQVSEAQTVYYVEDELDKNWSIPVHVKPRDLYDMGGEDGDTFHECLPFEQQNLEILFPDGEGNIPLTRSNFNCYFIY
uniref:Transposase-associated domain-containing protein n=1 Tax=Cajanus cajan TaxID=3821 RepID=A0A151RVI6_CAJCA|nr:hypothetical protein KK1_031844 [Cajanus cajan]